MPEITLKIIKLIISCIAKREYPCNNFPFFSIKTYVGTH